jgi:hypothetical protein
MKIVLYLFSLSFLILQSCSSDDSNSASNPTLAGKLKRIHLITSGGESQQNIDFFYDENGLLIKETTTDISNYQIAATVIYLRDSNGYIINQLQVNSSNYTTNTNYVVDTNGVYLSSVETITNAGVSNQISATYSYINNKISEINFSDGHQVKYTYDANGNCVKKEKFYDAPYKMDTVENIVFDNKVNPFQSSDILMYSYVNKNIGNNNATSSITTYYDNNNEIVGTLSYVFQNSYNSNNTPHTTVFTITDLISTFGGTSSGAFEFSYY